MKLLHKELNRCIEHGFECPYFEMNPIAETVNCRLSGEMYFIKDILIDPYEEVELQGAWALFKQCPLPEFVEL